MRFCRPLHRYKAGMEDLEDIIVNIRNGNLNTVEIQTILLTAQQDSKLLIQRDWKYVCDVIWDQLQKEHDNFEEQLLCCTCFYTVLPFTEKNQHYLRKILNMVQQEINADSGGRASCISLVYGLFQSAYLSRHAGVGARPPVLHDVLKLIVKLLVPLAYDYSRYTFIVFKIISLFKKVINTEYEKCIYSESNKTILINLVNHNWENPITGIRDLNRVIFNTLISVTGRVELERITQGIHGFNWNKAKYLMLSEIIEYRGNVDLFGHHQDWIKGVFYSLQKNGLVSAGADTYFAMLKSFKSLEKWCTLFLQKVLNVLTGSSKRAIQNFCNYWCLTTFRTYPDLIEILLQQMLAVPKSEFTNFSIVCIWKQANRLGYLDKNWDEPSFKQQLLQGLENSDIQMRIFAFDILCVSTKLNTIPNQEEYILIMDYLTNNVNSDSSVLRLNMLSSLTFFLTRIHSAFAHSYKHAHASGINEHLTQFCTNIQQLLIDSLTMQGNYQRKIASLKLCHVVIRYFREVPRKKQQSTTSYSLLQALKEQDLWMLAQESFVSRLMGLLLDPADDIRDSAMCLLLENYYDYLVRPDTLQSLTQKALEKIQSKFFYEINCGHTYFKLLLNIVIKEEQPDTMLKSADDIFDYAFKELFAEMNLKRDIVQSIEMGKQLHSFLSIMSDVLATCLRHQIGLHKLNKQRLNCLLKCLEDISNQFVSDESSNADFSKISDIVENTITNSGLTVEGQDESKISGIHQIVLNCMWLNVKECCLLSSMLIQFNEDPEVSRRCLHIITNVLETSRHKGAMEAAGSSLGQGIQCLTSLPRGAVRSDLPRVLLESKLNKLITDAGDTASVTRRGAGLSILVHRIVSSDAQKGKPLFHYFMKTLLAYCQSIDDVPPALGGDPDVANEKDLPKAVFIHFLTRIINDSSLASDVMFYSASLAKLAFDNLTSKHWQIRNAALQLYGALIPKLIGQNKQSGTDDETIATVAFDEFRTHSQELWRQVQGALRSGAEAAASGAGAGAPRRHAELVPLLNLLASCAKRYNFTCDTDLHAQHEQALYQDLFTLLGSSLYTVRRLAAKCIHNIFPNQTVFQSLMDLTVDITENALHGSLMLAQLYRKHYNSQVDNFKRLAELFVKIFNYKKHSYISWSIFENMFLHCDYDTLEKSFLEIRENIHEPGVQIWIKGQISSNLQDCSLEEFPKIFNLIIKQSNDEYYDLLLLELNMLNQTHLQSLEHVAKCLLDNEKHYDFEAVWKILYGCSMLVNIANLDKALTYFERSKVCFKNRYILPFLVRTIEHDNVAVKALSDAVFSLSDSETVDCDMRYVAALANNEFGKRFGELNDVVKMNAVKTAVMLLQDEDDTVRYVNVDFYRNITKAENSVHPYVCLNRLINLKFLESIFEQQENIAILCNDLLALHTTIKSNNTDEYNPFSNDTNNIYKENEFTAKLIRSITAKVNV